MPPAYRKADLDRLTSPEQLDQLLTVTTPRGWLALIAAAIIVASAGLWGLGGRVIDAIPGQCILVRSGGVQQVVFAYNGQVTDIRPLPGDFVRRGQVLARLSQPQLVEQINQLQDELAALPRRAGEAGPADHSDETAPQDRTGHPGDADRAAQLIANIQQLRTKLENQSRVVSPYDGRVVQLKADTFEFVQQGATLLTLELTGDQIKELEAVIYLPIDSGQAVRAGMAVQLVPTTVRKEEYGFMGGRVTAVSEFPAAAEDIRRVVGSEELARHFSGAVAHIEVRADLDLDPDTPSGYRWSSSKGPGVKINTGTLCSAAVVTGERSPLSLLFARD